MEKITELIAYLVAIENFCKDIHYTNVFYEDHLLADRIHDGISTHIDNIKEQIILAAQELPLSSKDYLKRAMEIIPDINSKDNKENWISLLKLIIETREFLNKIKVTDRGANALLDNIAQDLNTDTALIFIQTRRKDIISEAVKKDHGAATETPIDRKEFKAEEIKPTLAQALAVKYDNENVLVAEENVLDKLSKKLGLEG